MQGFKPVKENFDVSAKVAAVANTLQHHLQQKQVTVQNDIPANTIVNADRNMTAAILRNLISNAVKYSYNENVINVSATNTAGGCTIIVKDEGIGMNAAQTAAFNNSDLYQTESTRGTDNEKGTGLGLLLCKTFAGQMGGKITAINDDKGMTFKVWLPVN
jgi:signal transduction histidine kinase